MPATVRFILIALLTSAGPAQSPPDANIEKVFTFTVTTMLSDRQEISTAVRAVSDARHVSSDPDQRSLVLRGTPGQLAVAEWLFRRLDAQQSPTSAAEFRPGSEDDKIRVFYLEHTPSPQALQEVATAVRSITGVRKLFTYSSQKALTLRGTAGQMTLAEWLLKHLDRPIPEASAVNEFRPSSGDDVIRIFHLSRAGTPQRLQEITSEVRSMAEVPRAFIVNSQNAVAMRGTAAQITLAAQLIRERDQ